MVRFVLVIFVLLILWAILAKGAANLLAGIVFIGLCVLAYKVVTAGGRR